MKIREESIGKMAAFLAPSLKLKARSRVGPPIDDKIHRFLLRRFGGYTAAGKDVCFIDASGKRRPSEGWLLVHSRCVSIGAGGRDDPIRCLPLCGSIAGADEAVSVTFVRR